MFRKTSQNLQINTKSSHPKLFYKKGLLKNFTKFTEKRLYPNLFFSKVASSKPETVLKKRLQHLLRTACSKTSVLEFLFNKVASLTS